MAGQLLSVLLGAFLVVCGVLAAGLADRIRGNRSRERAERAPRRPATARTPVSGLELAYPNPATAAMAADVELALVGLGYDKFRAASAAFACAGTERATLETWTRAALRNCKPKDAAS